MENNQQSSDKSKTLTLIPKNAIINVEISGEFLGRCQSLLFAACITLGNDKMKQAYENFKDDKEPESMEEHIIFILTPLIHAIEQAANEQSKVITKELTPEEIEKLSKTL